MASLASLRNMVVHRYWEVDDIRIYREAKRRGIKILENFVKEMRKYAAKDP